MKIVAHELDWEKLGTVPWRVTREDAMTWWQKGLYSPVHTVTIHDTRTPIDDNVKVSQMWFDGNHGYFGSQYRSLSGGDIIQVGERYYLIMLPAGYERLEEHELHGLNSKEDLR